MSTNKKSPQKSAAKSTAPKKATTKKPASGAKTTAAAKPKPTSAQGPKKKPGRPKKQTQNPSIKYKADAKDLDRDDLIQAPTKAIEPKNVQVTGAGIPSASTTTKATGATPKVDINLSWQNKKPAGFWARLGSKLKRKK